MRNILSSHQKFGWRETRLTRRPSHPPFLILSHPQSVHDYFLLNNFSDSEREKGQGVGGDVNVSVFGECVTPFREYFKIF